LNTLLTVLGTVGAVAKWFSVIRKLAAGTAAAILDAMLGARHVTVYRHHPTETFFIEAVIGRGRLFRETD
jgi:hypothetical protein